MATGREFQFPPAGEQFTPQPAAIGETRPLPARAEGYPLRTKARAAWEAAQAAHQAAEAERKAKAHAEAVGLLREHVRAVLNLVLADDFDGEQVLLDGLWFYVKPAVSNSYGYDSERLKVLPPCHECGAISDGPGYDVGTGRHQDTDDALRALGAAIAAFPTWPLCHDHKEAQAEAKRTAHAEAAARTIQPSPAERIATAVRDLVALEFAEQWGAVDE